MNNYYGHIAILDGKITIDLGGKILPDGVYSIIQEYENTGKRKLKDSKVNKKHQPYDKEEFLKKIIDVIGDKKMTMGQVAKVIGIPDNTLSHRVKSLNILHLFKLRKEISEYTP